MSLSDLYGKSRMIEKNNKSDASQNWFSELHQPRLQVMCMVPEKEPDLKVLKIHVANSYARCSQ